MHVCHLSVQTETDLAPGTAGDEPHNILQDFIDLHLLALPPLLSHCTPQASAPDKHDIRGALATASCEVTRWTPPREQGVTDVKPNFQEQRCVTSESVSRVAGLCDLTRQLASRTSLSALSPTNPWHIAWLGAALESRRRQECRTTNDVYGVVVLPRSVSSAGQEILGAKLLESYLTGTCSGVC